MVNSNKVDIQILGTLPGLTTSRVQLTPVERFIIGDDAFPFLREGRFGNFLTGPSMFPQGAAPRLKHLSFTFPAKWISRENIDLGMRHLPSLQRVNLEFIRKGTSHQEMEEAKAALRAAAEDHPNRPVLDLH